MNIIEAKKTHLMDYLFANGHNPVKISRGSAWFLSPMRQEKEPSFKVHLFKNIWYDFGIGEGGNLIDLVMKLKRVNLPDAVELISQNPYALREQYAELSDEPGRIMINRIQPLANPALIQYLQSRRVSLRFCHKFLKEAYYTVHGKQYFAIAFENNRGGYELRNAYFKTGSSPKFVTTIPGIDSERVNVFEGFMDFLSCCTYYNRIPTSKTIVLNSLSFLPRIEFTLKNAIAINLFLDNDPAGRTATYKINKKFKVVKDWAPVIYPDHKDFNEFLMK